MNDTKKTPIGILGGTFDPIHYGHLRCAKNITEILNLSEMRFIPCKTPVHKTARATTEQRLAMLQLALDGMDNCILDDREIRRETRSYMVPTLESLRQEMPETPFCFVIGIDSFLTLDSWYQWEKLLQLTHLLITPRVGFALPKEGIIAKLYDSHSSTEALDFHRQKAGRVMMLNTPIIKISATIIREKIARQEDISDLIPPPVHKYITENAIYESKE